MPGKRFWGWVLVASSVTSMGCCGMCHRWCGSHGGGYCQPACYQPPNNCCQPQAYYPSAGYPPPAGAPVAGGWNQPRQDCCR